MLSINVLLDARGPASFESHSLEEEEELEEIQKSAVSFEESHESEKDDDDLHDQSNKPHEHESKFGKHLKEKTVT